MSMDIFREMDFLLYTVVMGAVITAVYDVFRIVRRVIKHNLFWISFEDIIFWIGCFVGIFYILYKENNGTLRWFAVMGALIGMVLYRLTLGQVAVKWTSFILIKLLKALEKVLLFLLKPLAAGCKAGRAVSRRAGRKTRLLGLFMKKKLTAFRKMFKIILCKH